MNKNAFAENEESDLLQNLFREKQRVQELEDELERVHKTSKNALEIGSDQTLKFKQLVGILRKKYDEAQHRNTDTREKFDKFLLEHDKLKKALEHSLQEQKCKDELLQTTHAELNSIKEHFQKLDVENQDREEELHSLNEQLIKLKDLLQSKETEEQNIKTELEAYKQKQRQFERVVQYLRKRLEESHLEHKELHVSFQNTQQSNRQLEDNLNSSTALAASLQNELQALKEAQLKNEQIENIKNIERKEFLEEQLQILLASKDQLESIKIAIAHDLKEFKEEKLKSEELNLAKIAHLEEERNAIQESKLEEIQRLSSIIEEWQNKDIEAKKDAEEANSLQLQLAQIKEENKNYLERISLLEANKEESEASLRMAQQHLAKKVRETTVIAEENEELKQLIQDLQNELDLAKLKVIELQNGLEKEFQNQKRLQEQYQEGLKSFELHTLKWEEKYFTMQQKWQEAEGRLREFQNFEEKYQKMHSILNHLSNLLGKPIVLPVGELSHSFDTITIEKEKNLHFEHPTLFDLPLFSKEVKTLN